MSVCEKIRELYFPKDREKNTSETVKRGVLARVYYHAARWLTCRDITDVYISQIEDLVNPPEQRYQESNTKK